MSSDLGRLHRLASQGAARLSLGLRLAPFVSEEAWQRTAQGSLQPWPPSGSRQGGLPLDAYCYAGVFACVDLRSLTELLLEKRHAAGSLLFAAAARRGCQELQGWPLAGRQLVGDEALTPAGVAALQSWQAAPLRPCLFLDRDGVVVEDRHYAYKPADLVLLPGVIPLIRWARSQGWRVCVVSNQAGVAKGYFTKADLELATQHVQALLAAAGASADGWYYATSHPEGIKGDGCGASFYRKPGPGMLLQAAYSHRLDLSRSWMVGDKDSDVIEDLPGGLRCVLLAGEYSLSRRGVPQFAQHADLLAYLQQASTAPPTA